MSIGTVDTEKYSGKMGIVDFYKELFKRPSIERVRFVQKLVARVPALSEAEAAILTFDWMLGEAFIPNEAAIKDKICIMAQVGLQSFYKRKVAPDFRLCMPIILGWEQYCTVIDSVKDKKTVRVNAIPERAADGSETVRFSIVCCDEADPTLGYTVQAENLDECIDSHLNIYHIKSATLHELVKSSMPALQSYDDAVFEASINAVLKQTMLNKLEKDEIPEWVFTSINKFLDLNKITPEDRGAFIDRFFLSSIPIFCVTSVQLMVKVIRQLGTVLMRAGRCSYMDIANFEELKL